MSGASAVTPSTTWVKLLPASMHLMLPIGVIACIVVLLVPLPSAVLDILLSANIALAVIMLLTAMQIKTPLEFSVFPTLLLATTLSRLVLNVASTRLILTQAESLGIDAAGDVVRTFAEFVTGDRLVVGVIMFVILIVIQFVVITQGSTRISEVAARFALDGLPGKQMAVDSDLAAGVINDTEARRRRDEIAQQSDFYAAMDGASKFVRGDAIAGLVITGINIGGGLFVGLFEAGMSLPTALEVFTRLTIGDGLVSQVPALLISLAAGILVTRSGRSIDLSQSVARQLFFRPEVLAVTAAFLLLMILTSLPKIPLLLLGGGCLGLAFVVARQRPESADADAKETTPVAAAPAEPRLEDLLQVDPLELEIGVALIRLADPQRGGDLLARIQHVRHSVAAELGIILPKVRIRDNVRLERGVYRIKLADSLVAEGEIQIGRLLAIDWGAASGSLPGPEVCEPAYGLPAWWIEPTARESAERQGFNVVEATSVIATHLTQVIRRHADELLSREATRHLLEGLKRQSPAVVDELVPGLLKVGDVQRVLQLLLKEGVPIRNLAAILEALGDHAHDTHIAEELVEHVRAKQSRLLSGRYRDPSKRLYVATVDAGWEERLAAGALSPQARDRFADLVASEVEKLSAAGRPRVLLVSPPVRSRVKDITSSRVPDLIVLSHAEITSDTRIETLAHVGPPVTAGAA